MIQFNSGGICLYFKIVVFLLVNLKVNNSLSASKNRQYSEIEKNLFKMSEYWKSLPKKYCTFCKVWITDNKISRDFHERGLRHLGNVQRRVSDIQRNSSIQEREQQKYNAEIAKIEASALGSFQNDIARDPSLSKEIAQLKPFSKQTDKATTSEQQEGGSTFNRFGQSVGDDSETLVSGKKRALETIAKAFEKKSKWLEAKTAEGTQYYWNKDTLETKYEAPKSGFLSLKEQNQFKSVPSSSLGQNSFNHSQVSNQRLRGGWKEVDKTEETTLVDLQLPNQDISQIMLDLQQGSNEDAPEVKEEPIVIKEKTVDDLKRPLSLGKDANVSFKKRATVKRNIRSRDQTE